MTAPDETATISSNSSLVESSAGEGDTAERHESPFGAAILGTLGGLLGVSLMTMWVLSSYLHIDIWQILSFRGADGWCDPTKAGLGVHCWGDWAAIQVDSFDAEGSSAEAVYPLSARILRLPFMGLNALAGPLPTLIVFLAVSLICLLVPACWAARAARPAYRPVVLTVLGAATVPVLMVLDRGNILALAVPFCFLAVLGLVRDRPWMVVLGTVVAASVKPQFALLAFGLVALRRWRPAVITALGSVAVVVLPYLVYGGKALERVTDWVDLVSKWSTGVRIDDPGSTIVSEPRALWLLLHPAHWATLDNHLTTAGAAAQHQHYLDVCLALTAVVLVLVLAAGRRIPILHVGTLLLLSASLASPRTYAYYQVFAVVIVALAFRLPTDSTGLVVTGGGARRWVESATTVAMGCALVLGLTPLPVPIGQAPTSLVPVLSTLAWLAYLVLMGVRAVFALVDARRSRSATSGTGVVAA